MYFARFLPLVLASLVVAQSPPGTLVQRSVSEYFIPAKPKAVIAGLLDKRSLIRGRQVTGCGPGFVCQGSYCCNIGESCCSDGACCPFGYYCDTVNGVLGCCRTGRICSGPPQGCADSGYSPCVNDNYCCPTGDTCYRDSNGIQSCASGGGGTSTTFTRTSTSFVGGSSSVSSNLGGGGGGTSVTFDSGVLGGVSSTTSSSIPNPTSNSIPNPTSSSISRTPTSIPLIQQPTHTTSTTTSSTSSGLTGLSGSSAMRDVRGVRASLLVLPIIGLTAVLFLFG